MTSTKTSSFDLVLAHADLVVTMDGPDIPGGWIAIKDGFIAEIGHPGSEPLAVEVRDAGGCLITPGLVNTHHHMYQTYNRQLIPRQQFSGLVDWLNFYYPVWERLDEEAVYLSTWISLADLAQDGCTTTSDHLNIHPKRNLLDAEIRAAREIGIRFHPTRGAMNLSRKDGRLPPDTVVESEDEILADSTRLVQTYHDPNPGAMLRIALAPCNPFAVSHRLMERAAELAEKMNVRLHTHFSESIDEVNYCLATYGCRPFERFKDVGWGSDRTWVAHSIFVTDEEIKFLGKWGTSVAHCPTCNMRGTGQVAPIAKMKAAGVNVGLSTDAAPSLRCEMLQARKFNQQIHGTHLTARELLTLATLGSAQCLGRSGEIGVLKPGAAADIVVWPLPEAALGKVGDDLLEEWVGAGPIQPRDTVVHGKFLVRDGKLLNPNWDDRKLRHDRIAVEWQKSINARKS
jgi:cytosine/adenosine deaminase-related metal-dependent hydrolase